MGRFLYSLPKRTIAQSQRYVASFFSRSCCALTIYIYRFKCFDCPELLRETAQKTEVEELLSAERSLVTQLREELSVGEASLLCLQAKFDQVVAEKAEANSKIGDLTEEIAGLQLTLQASTDENCRLQDMAKTADYDMVTLREEIFCQQLLVKSSERKAQNLGTELAALASEKAAADGVLLLLQSQFRCGAMRCRATTVSAVSSIAVIYIPAQ